MYGLPLNPTRALSVALDTLYRGDDITGMRRLILLRHAKTERADPGGRDRDRKLMKRGRSDASIIGLYMARHGLIPDLALVSPATRAEETWRLAAAAFPQAPPMLSNDRIYNADTAKLLRVIGEAHKEAHTLIVVGHNPGLHDLAVLLIASGEEKARERIREKLPTSGLVVIDLPLDDWSLVHAQAGRLERFVSPSLLAPAPD
jgi:phosphohistidine phosphatase